MIGMELRIGVLKFEPKLARASACVFVQEGVVLWKIF